MLTKPALGLIALWRNLVSPFLPAACRFHPSCSQYASGAIEACGVARGSWLAIKRLARCHPFHPGGVDLPPAKKAS